MTQASAIEYDAAFRERVLKTYFADGILLFLPEDRKKRKVLLDRMAEDLEPNRPYGELELNFRILDHYDDCEAVRKAMLEESILKKERNMYIKEI